MQEKSTYQHGSGYTPSDIPEPPFPEKVKTLVYRNKIATLSTISRRHPEWPFGSLMPYATDSMGLTIFLVSTMAMHTQNIEKDGRASLFISQIEHGDNPLNASRVTLMGNIRKVGENDIEKVRKIYLSTHPDASYWVDFSDFSFYIMDYVDIYFVGGFGSMGWVDVDKYYSAEVDPLADSAKGIISHMNTDHADSLVTLADRYLGLSADRVEMVSVDRLGFNVRVSSGDRIYGRRIAFTREVKNSNQAREVLIEMVK